MNQLEILTTKLNKTLLKAARKELSSVKRVHATFYASHGITTVSVFVWSDRELVAHICNEKVQTKRLCQLVRSDIRTFIKTGVSA